MGALANAVALRADPVWREWLITAAAYQARLVLLESADTPQHPIRERLARDVATTPQMIADMLVTIVSTDPEVATKGGTPALVGEAMVLDKLEEVWTAVARLYYPAEAPTPPPL
jgi:hypothetical protein